MDTLFFRKMGSGYPLICLHGYALDHTIWLKVANEIQSGVNLILPDLRGHGKSFASDGVYSMRSMAEDILRVLDLLRIDRAFIAGHSMGGYISLALAENHSDRLSGLALVASHPFADTPEKKKARLEESKKVSQQKSNEPITDMAQKLSKESDVIDFCISLISTTNYYGIIGGLAGMAERPEMVDQMNALKIPMFLIAGTNDQLIPIVTIEEMALKIPGLQIEMIKNAGHMLMMEKPEETATALLKFTNQVRN